MKTIGIDCQGGKGASNYVVDASPTLAAISHGTPHAVAIVCDPIHSNSMKSKNPHSGFHREDVCCCLDTSSQNPIRNGGGMLIVERRK